MGFKIVIVPPNTQPDWPQKIRAVVPALPSMIWWRHCGLGQSPGLA
jgi:hypothetical protein